MKYEEWASNAVSEQTIQVNRDTVRDIYTFPNGVKAIDDLVLPWNPLQMPRRQVTLDYTVPDNDPVVLAAGATIERWYEEEGFGHPQFHGTEGSMEKAFALAHILKKV